MSRFDQTDAPSRPLNMSAACLSILSLICFERMAPRSAPVNERIETASWLFESWSAGVMPTSPNRSKRGGQKALVIGISDYPAPIPKLPAVAADVREMAKLLQSKYGAFPSSGVTVLTDKQAGRQSIRDALRATFEQATEDETLFVYLAGHGGAEGDNYYYIAHDRPGRGGSGQG
jgi:hypothetical protein